MTQKITKKDNYVTLSDVVSTAAKMGIIDNDVQDRLHAFIDHELDLMAQRAEKSKTYQQEHKAENDAMIDLIMDVLSENSAPMSVMDIVGKITDSTPQKVIYRLGKLYNDGKITKSTETIKMAGAPTRKITFYKIQPTDVTE